MKVKFKTGELCERKCICESGVEWEDYEDVIDALHAAEEINSIQNLRFLNYHEIEKKEEYEIFSVSIDPTHKLIVHFFPSQNSNGDATLFVHSIQ